MSVKLLPLAFFIDSPGEMGKSDSFLQYFSSNKVSKATISSWSCVNKCEKAINVQINPVNNLQKAWSAKDHVRKVSPWKQNKIKENFAHL